MTRYRTTRQCALFFTLMAVFLLAGCRSKSKTAAKEMIMKSEAEWKAVLSPEAFHVLRKKGTEPPFSGEYNNFKKDGIYVCAGCGNTLFDAKSKYDSGSGWPSFKKALTENTIRLKGDMSHSMVRMEVVCARCEGHLGHVFDDGPAPTGKRYCINSVALKFKERDALKEP